MELYEDFEELSDLPRIKNMPIEKQYRGSKAHSLQKSAQYRLMEREAIQEQLDDVREYSFSYKASRHERAWILDSLGLFYETQWFADVVRLVKGGKEASVYQCQTAADSPIKGRFIAAKVYRPRRFRNLRQDYIYREGREELDDSGNVIIDEGMLKAIRQRSEYGRQVMHSSWLEHEYKTMNVLYTAGADIPRPYASGKNAILMDFVGDTEHSAPTLNTIELDSAEARILFEQVLHNVEIMLAHDRVHADLSAYNLLYWQGEIRIIDFPQAIAPRENRNAYSIFERDIQRLCEYFSAQGVMAEYRDLACKLWQANDYRFSPEIHPILLDEEDEKDREYWDRLIYK
jgi:RIO kinase 1